MIKVADAGKVYDFLKVRGMSRARYEACLQDQNSIKKLQASASEAQTKYGLQFTPTFVINGQTRSELLAWPDVDAALKQLAA